MTYTAMTEEEDRELRRQFAAEQARQREILDDMIELVAERRRTKDGAR